MAEIQTIIGSLPVCRGEYDAEVSYFRDNQVTMYGSTFQSIADDNVGYPPAEERNDGKVYAINTDKWIIVANALAAYNAGKRIDDLAENTEIKDEEGNVQDTPFRVIENEEFIMAVVDSEDRVLFGIYRATGKPYYPLNEMYHIEQNEEFFAVWLDADDKVLLGIRRDGEIIGEIHAVNALKQVISQLQSGIASLQEKLGIVDSNLKELLDVFSLQENEEFLAVEQDAEGKILSSTNADGSHYIHNAKSETIPTEFEHIEDPEGRMEITTDSEGKILSERRENGEKYERYMEIDNLKVSNLKLQENSVKDIQDAFKMYGFNLASPVDWSDNKSAIINEPRLAIVNFTTPYIPYSKNDNLHATMSFHSIDGTYFKKNIILNLQGNTSLAMPQKNFAIDICNDEWKGKDTFSLKIGDWVPQDSFHLKAYYMDITKGIAPTAYALYNDIVKTRGIDNDRPYKRYINKHDNILDNYSVEPLCFPMGFPCLLYINDEFYGIMSWQLKKHRDNYKLNKNNASNIHLDGSIGGDTFFGGTINWGQFEIRNPKSLISVDGNDYDGDHPSEIIGDDSEIYDASNKKHVISANVKKILLKMSKYLAEIDAIVNEDTNNTVNIRKAIEDRFDVPCLIDYFIFIIETQNADSYYKNWQWTSWDGIHLCVNPYDLDSCWGIQGATGAFVGNAVDYIFGTELSTPLGYVYKYYRDDIDARYKELRDLKVISYDNIFGKFLDWCKRIGTESLNMQVSRWSESPGFRPSQINDDWERTGYGYVPMNDMKSDYRDNIIYSKGQYCCEKSRAYVSLTDNNLGNYVTDTEHWKDVSWKEGNTYNKDDTCLYGVANFYEFKAKTTTMSPPLKKFYNTYPYELGFGYDSIYRVSEFIKEKINITDKNFNYNI